MIKDADVLLVKEPEVTAMDRLYLNQVVAGLGITFKHMFGRKMTLQYPEERRELNGSMHVPNYRGLHRLNKDLNGHVACVACFMCSTACPAHCIHIEAGEAPWPDREKYPVKFDLDELRCIYCGMCEEACPVDAIELTYVYDVVGQTREEMIFDKEKLLDMFDRTKDVKPRKEPRIPGYPHTGKPADAASAAH